MLHPAPGSKSGSIGPLRTSPFDIVARSKIARRASLGIQKRRRSDLRGLLAQTGLPSESALSGRARRRVQILLSSLRETIILLLAFTLRFFSSTVAQKVKELGRKLLWQDADTFLQGKTRQAKPEKHNQKAPEDVTFIREKTYTLPITLERESLE